MAGVLWLQALPLAICLACCSEHAAPIHDTRSLSAGVVSGASGVGPCALGTRALPFPWHGSVLMVWLVAGTHSQSACVAGPAERVHGVSPFGPQPRVTVCLDLHSRSESATLSGCCSADSVRYIRGTLVAIRASEVCGALGWVSHSSPGTSFPGTFCPFQQTPWMRRPSRELRRLRLGSTTWTRE